MESYIQQSERASLIQRGSFSDLAFALIDIYRVNLFTKISFPILSLIQS